MLSDRSATAAVTEGIWTMTMTLTMMMREEGMERSDPLAVPESSMWAMMMISMMTSDVAIARMTNRTRAKEKADGQGGTIRTDSQNRAMKGLPGGQGHEALVVRDDV
jgi:hypothetical protein